MRKTFPAKITTLLCIAGFALAGETAAQESEPPIVKKVNFGYSQNPKTKPKTVETEKTNKSEIAPATETPNKPEIAPAETPNTTEPKTIEPNPIDPKPTEPATLNAETTIGNAEFESRSAANKTLEVVKRASTLAVAPTEIYKIGVGDVLFISLQNAAAKDSTYFTVLNDGTIDYPLAGEMIQVGGLTTEEIEDLLKTKIKLYDKPQVSVKVREHASHRITVLGLVEKAGEKFLPREAVPLFLIRAEAIVQPRANVAVIKRLNSETERIDLTDSKSDEVLIFSGDIIEFKSSDAAVADSSAAQFYFIGGNVVSGGQKTFHHGLTLTQAILASGGLKKQTVKKVVLRRKNQEGLLSPLEFDLNSIKAGKQPDPILQAGDTIEVVN